MSSFLNMLNPFNYFSTPQPDPYSEQLRRGKDHCTQIEIDDAMSTLLKKSEWCGIALTPDEEEYFEEFRGKVFKLTFPAYYYTHPHFQKILERILKVCSQCPQLKVIETKDDQPVDRSYQRPGYIFWYPPVYHEQSVSHFYREMLNPNSSLVLFPTNPLSDLHQEPIDTLSITHKITLGVFTVIAQNSSKLQKLKASVDIPTDQLEQFQQALTTLRTTATALKHLDLSYNLPLNRQALAKISLIPLLKDLKIKCPIEDLTSGDHFSDVFFPSRLDSFYLENVNGNQSEANTIHIGQLTRTLPSHLTSLSLINIKVNSNALSSFAHFSSLSKLSIHCHLYSHGNLITRLGTAVPQLHELSILNWRIDFADISEFSRFRDLKQLAVSLPKKDCKDGLPQSFLDLKQNNDFFNDLNVRIQPLEN